MIKSLIKICFQPNKDNKYAIGLGLLNLVQLLNNCVLHRTSRQNCRLHSYHAIHKYRMCQQGVRLTPWCQ